MASSTPPRPVAVLVLGMHRSGTSALTRVLNWMGVELGDSLMAPAAQNETGFWEHDDVVAVHDRLLEALGSSWHDVRSLTADALASDTVRPFRDELVEIVRRDFGGVPVWGLKDPRICRLLPLWRDVLAEVGCDARYVLTTRHPSEVAASLAARDGFPAAHSELLWLGHTLAAERETRGCPRAFVTYDQLLADGRTHASRIAREMGLDASAALGERMNEIDAFLDAKHRHHAANEPPAHPWARAVLQAFESATRGAPFPTEIDRVAAAVDASVALFHPWVTDLEANGSRLRDLVRERGAKIAQLRGGASERDAGATSPHRAAREIPEILRLPGTAISRTYDAPEGNPEVSIVIPLYNQAALTLQCLQSLVEHTKDGSFEVVLVDNASADGTADLLAGLDGNVKIVSNEKNLGFAQACNQGAAAASTDRILFLNNDIEALPNWLEPMLEILRRDPNVGIVGSKLLFPNRTIQHAGVVLCDRPGHAQPIVATHVSYQSPEDHASANERREFQAVTGACLLIRRDLFDRVGGFDTFYWNGLEDIDLCLKVRALGFKIVYEPTSVLVHHESQSGPERFVRALDNERLFCQRWLGKVQPDFVPLPDGQYARVEPGHVRPYDLPARGSVTLTTAGDRVASIVIVTRNGFELTRACFDSIARHTMEPHEVIFVDNASTDRTREYLGHLARERENVRVVAKSRNLGFAGGVNQGLALARGCHIVLLNNDTVVTEGWLGGLLDTFDAHPEAGIVGPVTNRASGPQVIANVPYRTLPEMDRFARTWMDEHHGETIPARRLVAFCWAMRREVVDAIGGFDERFEIGNCEDDDYCLRAHQAGFTTCIARGVFIHHTGSQTFAAEKIDYAALLATNFERFKVKWGMNPSAMPEHGYPFEKLVAGPKQPRVDLPDVASRHLPTLGGRWYEDKTAPATAPRPPANKSGRKRRTVTA